ncbi:MAG: phosphotransferase [Gammaproteobacteria bacterium]
MIVDRDGRPLEIDALAELVAREVFGDGAARLLGAALYGGAAGSSWRLDYEHAGTRRALFVKLPAERGPRHALFAARLREEYRISCEIKAAFPETAQLRTVTPAAFVEAVQGYASWAAAGESLEGLLRRACRRLGGPLEPARSRCALAAAWLSRFHRLPAPYGAADARALLDTYYDDRLVTLAQLPDSGLDDAAAADLKSMLMRLVDAALATQPVVRCHNDYSPHNLLVDGDTLCVLDYSFAGPGLPAFDVACFWHKLDDMRDSLLSEGRRVDALQAAFVDALATPFDPADHASRLGLARLVLSKMITVLRQPATRAGRRRVAGWRRWLESGLDPAEVRD